MVVFDVEPGPSDLALILAQYHHVNYSDPPIIALLLFHVFWLGLFFWKCRNLLSMSLQFCISCYAIFLSDVINEFLSSRWSTFGFSRNYFDTANFFIVAFWTLPLSLIAGFVILFLFSDLCQLLAVHRYFRAIVNINPRKKVKTD